MGNLCLARHWSLGSSAFALLVGFFLLPAASRAATPDPVYDTALNEHYGGGSSAEYFTAGTFSLGGATGSCVGTPAATVRTQTRGDSHAGSQVTYYCVVTGPDRFAAVPMSISYVLHASASGDSTHSRADSGATIQANGTITQYSRTVLASNVTGSPHVADDSGTASFSVRADGTASTIIVSASGGYVSGDGAGSPASEAYADPVISIDPAWADANPGYSVALSSGVGNGPPVTVMLTDPAHSYVFLQLAGVPNALNNVQVSPDLSPGSFVTIGSVNTGPTGTVVYDDINAGGLTRRFYRVSSP